MRSGISIGAPALTGSALTGPSTWTVPLSAPPRTTSIDGLTEPSGISAGLSITDFPNRTVRSKPAPFFVASIRTGEVTFLSPMGVLQA